MLTEEQIREAEIILRKRKCLSVGHDFDVQCNRITNTPAGIRCARCGDYWRVFQPADPPTQVIQTIESPTQVMVRQQL